MLVDRCIIISVREEIKRLLELDTGDLRAFNVYNDSQLRAMNADEFAPRQPFCFLVVARIEPTTSQLPFIAVDVLPIRKRPLEIGNRNGRTATVDLNILGRTEGEVLDLASYLADGIGSSFNIKNQNDYAYRGYAPQEIMAKAQIIAEPEIEGPGQVATDLILEGRMHHWQILTFGFQVLL